MQEKVCLWFSLAAVKRLFDGKGDIQCAETIQVRMPAL
ncbi:hypothetical protein P262_03241 [Cronobacter malonaticus]|uniref:Uncharacterized protein n=1 Tax=Cronobacter malonaticus TaxID=413503 RepID=V5U1K0_9ENTR|nr:hypothetical protein P262_03241 [Cronobacter malonaticus]